MYGRQWSQAQKDWIIENYSKFDTIKDIADEFNKVFNEKRTANQLSYIATKQLGVKRNKNIGVYGKRKKEELPIGTIRKAQNRAYIKVKPCYSKVKISGYAKPYWLPLQEKIYQDEYGEIPPDHFVCFLNGDTNDFSSDNLYAINKKISCYMSKMKWWTNDKLHTLTAIKYCELFYQINETSFNNESSEC